MDEEFDKLKDVPEGGIDVLVAHAEKMIDGQLQLGIAADQKATTFFGGFGAVGVALGGAAATMLAANAATFHKTIAACTVSSVVMLASIFCFARAALPQDFHVAGHEPTLLANSATDRPLTLRHIAASLQRRITFNRTSPKETGAWTKRGMAFAALAAILGAMAYFVA